MPSAAFTDAQIRTVTRTTRNALGFIRTATWRTGSLLATFHVALKNRQAIERKKMHQKTEPPHQAVHVFWSLLGHATWKLLLATYVFTSPPSFLSLEHLTLLLSVLMALGSVLRKFPKRLKYYMLFLWTKMRSKSVWS